jgi:ribosomal protein uS19
MGTARASLKRPEPMRITAAVLTATALSEMSKFAQRNYTYRGKTLDDLRAMKLPDFVKLLGSSGRRWFGRAFGIQEIHLIRKLSAARAAVAGQVGVRPNAVRTHLRSMIVLPEFVDNVIAVFNGKDFVEFQVRPEMIGHVFAEFAPSKRLVKHSKAGVGATGSSSATSLK